MTQHMLGKGVTPFFRANAESSLPNERMAAGASSNGF